MTIKDSSLLKGFRESFMQRHDSFADIFRQIKSLPCINIHQFMSEYVVITNLACSACGEAYFRITQAGSPKPTGPTAGDGGDNSPPQFHGFVEDPDSKAKYACIVVAPSSKRISVVPEPTDDGPGPRLPSKLAEFVCQSKGLLIERLSRPAYGECQSGANAQTALLEAEASPVTAPVTHATAGITASAVSANNHGCNTDPCQGGGSRSMNPPRSTQQIYPDSPAALQATGQDNEECTLWCQERLLNGPHPNANPDVR